jgi:hypothetical protein
MEPVGGSYREGGEMEPVGGSYREGGETKHYHLRHRLGPGYCCGSKGAVVGFLGKPTMNERAGAGMMRDGTSGRFIEREGRRSGEQRLQP